MSVRPNYVPTILIIDDEPFNLEFLEIVLKQQGYNIITATNGLNGRNLAKEKQPDLILLDIMMPGENGFESATVLRLSPETSEIPIIFLTALDDNKNTTKGYDSGAVDFIVKPFEYKDVIHRIRLHLTLAANDKKMLPAIKQEPSWSNTGTQRVRHLKGSRSTFPHIPPETKLFIYESVVLSDSTEGHLILNFSNETDCTDLRQHIKHLLADNTGPLFTPSITMRNIGFKLKSIIGDKAEINGSYTVINREAEKLTVVNTGALPQIFLQPQKPPLLIERQSGDIGTLGMGIPPCATYDMKKGDRIFMFSNGMLAAYSSDGEAINELKEACALSARVDIETACQAAGEMLQKNGNQLNGILVAVEV